MKKKLLHVIPLAILFIVFNIFILNISVNAKEKTYNPKHLIAEMKKEKIQLYYDKKSNGMLKGFYLKSGKKVKYFNWKNVNNSSFYPSINLMKDNYIAIICTEGTGTGVNFQKLYIINRETLEVLDFKNPLDVIKSNVTFSLKAPEVKINIKNNIWQSAYTDIELSHFLNTVGYGSIVHYDIHDGYFNVTVSAQVTPALFIGDFNLCYRWNEKETKFIPHDINFNFYESEINE